MKKYIIIALSLCVSVTAVSFAGVKKSAAADAEEYTYLNGIAKDSWACIDYLVEPKTGLPYDISRKKPTYTSVSNIGLYAAAVSIAVEMKFIDRKEGIQKLSQLLDSFDKFPTWNGFTQSWHDVVTLQPSTDDPWISILDSGNLAAGFIVARQEFPELNKRISKLLDAMDWSKVYNPNKKLLIGGYSMKSKQLNNSWLLSVMGTDARGAFIESIGSNKVPAEMWGKVSKSMEYKYGLKYYQPGWSGGGLFMQMIDTCFFDLRYTGMWRSAASFARAQIFHAKMIGAPVWGWSACDSPSEGYLGYNNWRDYIVTPHASVLPISIFPKESIANLRKLEELGARQDFETDGNKSAFGFRDSIDFVKGRPTNTYLMLDQGMLFLSLCNYLSDGKVWELSNRDPIIKNARKLIPDLQPDRQGYEKFAETLYPKGIFVTCKSVYSKKEYKTGENLKCDIFVACEDKDIKGSYTILWRLFDKNTEKMLKNGSKTVNISNGTMETVDSFQFPVEEDSYLLQAVVVAADGSQPANDTYNFSGVNYIELAGDHPFKVGDDMKWSKPGFDDGSWVKISVPGRWDDQGYPSKDNSYQWYRIHVTIPVEMKNRWSDGEVYFSAGGIDDGEQAYFNGELIGTTSFPPNYKEGFWDKERNYKIPVKSIKYGGDNILAIRVYNYIREGGIWKGPIRLVHKKQAGSAANFMPPSWE